MTARFSLLAFLAARPASPTSSSLRASNISFGVKRCRSASMRSGSLSMLPATSPFNSANTITRAQSLLAFPQFTNLWLQQYNGRNRYNALQLQVTQRFSKNLTFAASYTRSRLQEFLNYLNPSDTDLEKRISPDDRPDRFTTSVV